MNPCIPFAHSMCHRHGAANQNQLCISSDHLKTLPMKSVSNASVLIVEDRVHTAEKMRVAIDATDGLAVSGMAFDVDTGLHQLNSGKPRVVLVDLGLPDGSGLEIIQAANAVDWDCECLVISVFGDEKRVFSALKAGAKGYILKGSRSEDIGQSVKELLLGGSPMSPKIARYLLSKMASSKKPDSMFFDENTLSDREVQVMELIALGLKRQDVADRLGIRLGTVGTHIHKIYSKLGVNSNVEAIREAAKKGII